MPAEHVRLQPVEMRRQLVRRLRENAELPAARAEAISVACPSCMTLELARACAPYVRSIVHGADFVPSMDENKLEDLRREVRCVLPALAFSL